MHELSTFKYPESVYTISNSNTQDINSPVSLDQVPLTIVETSEQFYQLLDRLSIEKEIAVDLENHNYRSFQGFVCLMQISTRREDFIINAISCRHLMHHLNVIFTDPKVLKVFHGADSDICWLQRDFGIYVVTMFDTYIVSKKLSNGSCSLDYLIKKHSNVTVNKRFQLADWRIRPLPLEMVEYARQDTRYLLSIYDEMKNELISLSDHRKKENPLKQVLTSSTAICKRLYRKEKHNPMLWRSIIQKYNYHPNKLSPSQIGTLKQILEWRDNLAISEDESLHYVMPKAMAMRITVSMPRSPKALMRCYQPSPPLVKQNIHDLLIIIRNNVNSNIQNDSDDQSDNQSSIKVNDSNNISNSNRIVTVQPHEAAKRSHKFIFDDETNNEPTFAFEIPRFSLDADESLDHTNGLIPNALLDALPSILLTSMRHGILTPNSTLRLRE